MKTLIIVFVLLTIVFASYAQEVEINEPVVATAGNDQNLEKKAPVNISKWRLGEVYVLTLPLNEIKSNSEDGWRPEVFPNPFYELLSIAFKTNEHGAYTIRVSDISGKRTWFTENKTVFPNQVIELNLGSLDPAIYLLTIIPEKRDKKWVTKIQKQ